jgi:hypothetical protein
MVFINLEWVLGLRRIRRFEIAQLLKISEGALCNRLTGKTEFLPHEKQRVAEYVGFQPEWLFAQLTPPHSARITRVDGGHQVETAALAPARETR